MLTGAVALCLAWHFEWDGAVFRTGRRPIYGIEIPNVKPTREGHQGPRLVYPLTPIPVRKVAEGLGNQGISILFDPPPPAGARQLLLRLALAPCQGKNGKGGVKALPEADSSLQSMTAEIQRVVRSRETAGQSREAREPLKSGSLSVNSPLNLVVDLGAPADGWETIELELRSPAVPDFLLRAQWARGGLAEKLVWKSK
jgi:hypothetical protein